jgi:hypothetical protein
MTYNGYIPGVFILRHLKITFRADGMAQVVECLPSKHESLTSNPTAPRKKSSKNHIQLKLFFDFCLDFFFNLWIQENI